MPFPFTNLISQPDDLSSAAWTKNNGATATYPSAATAPNGSGTACYLKNAAGLAAANAGFGCTTARGDTVEFSVWLLGDGVNTVATLLLQDNVGSAPLTLLDVRVVQGPAAVTGVGTTLAQVTGLSATVWSLVRVTAVATSTITGTYIYPNGNVGTAVTGVHVWHTLATPTTLLPRVKLPRSASRPQVSTGLISEGWSGRIQRRPVTKLGVRWREAWPPLLSADANTQALLAALERAFQQQTLLDVAHLRHSTLLGGGTGAVYTTVNNQSGSVIDTAGWTGSAPALRAGDVFRIDGVPVVLRAAADVTPAAGVAAIVVHPPVPAAYAIPQRSMVTYNASSGAVRYGVYVEAFQEGEEGVDGFLTGVTATFREAW